VIASHKIRLHSEHGRREDHHEHVVDRVADIDEADHAARCRHTPPLDVAPETALRGSSERLCPGSDHRRKADKMKSSDPADYQDTPRPSPDGEGVTSTPGCEVSGDSGKVTLMSPCCTSWYWRSLHRRSITTRPGAGHIAALILDEVRTLDAQSLHVPLRRDKCRRTVCATLLHEPGRPETLEVWSDIAGARSGTLARLSARETGMRPVDWRHQARLADALVRLA
jgi:hypothetical protein